MNDIIRLETNKFLRLPFWRRHPFLPGQTVQLEGRGIRDTERSLGIRSIHFVTQRVSATARLPALHHVHSVVSRVGHGILAARLVNLHIGIKISTEVIVLIRCRDTQSERNIRGQQLRLSIGSRHPVLRDAILAVEKVTTESRAALVIHLPRWLATGNFRDSTAANYTSRSA